MFLLTEEQQNIWDLSGQLVSSFECQNLTRNKQVQVPNVFHLAVPCLRILQHGLRA